jgi:glycosyltransferase involved in cell wall biosynthesis
VKRSLQVALSILGGAALGVAALAPNEMAMVARAWLLFVGFGSLTAALALGPRRAWLPLFIAIVFTTYGGLSALVAIPPSAEEAASFARHLTPDQVKASIPSVGYDTEVTDKGFAYAARITVLAGIAMIAAALAASSLAGPRRTRSRTTPGRIEQAGRTLVVIGFLGVAAALTRFALTQIPTDDLFKAFKSFWVGGSYFLLVATFAVPGFGLWLLGALKRGPSRHDLAVFGSTMVIYLGLLVPTGQRGFAVALGLMILTILIFDGRVSLRAFLAIVAVGIVLIGATQAARNQARETGGISAGGYFSRIVPSQWRDLYGSQLASFNWTILVTKNRDRLDIPNPFPEAVLKPIPRQILPGKSQGFGTEFTERVYPGAAEQSVSFAVPLTAETDYAFGPFGVLFVFLLLGGGLAFMERRLGTTGSSPVWPVVLATLAWCAYVLVRGDFANALVFSAGWVLPLALMARSIGLRSEAPPRRIVIDALQVAPEFSGIGRRVAEIGQSLREVELPLPLTVRCGADVVDMLRPEFPPGTHFHTPLRSSRPRWLRIAYQQIFRPVVDSASSVLICPGDQAPLWGRSPLVFIVHDVRRVTHPETSTGRIEAFYYRTVMRVGARRARCIVTISEFSKSEIERTLTPTCPIVVVAGHPKPLEGESRIEEERLTFLTVGALRRYKGLETVIEALSRINMNGGSAPRVVCIGSEEAGEGYGARLVAYAEELSVGDRFELAGWISDDQLRDLYVSCTGTINPSTYEGYGLPVAESLASGLPTIASDIPPHREIAADAAVYFDPGDADGLARAVSGLVADSELRTDLARRAIERARRLSESGTTWAEALLAGAVEDERAVAESFAPAAAR